MKPEEPSRKEVRGNLEILGIDTTKATARVLAALNHRTCCCVHFDARACLLHRHPELRRCTDVDDPRDPFPSWAEEQVCDCVCHREDEDDDRNLTPHPDTPPPAGGGESDERAETSNHD